MLRDREEAAAAEQRVLVGEAEHRVRVAVVVAPERPRRLAVFTGLVHREGRGDRDVAVHRLDLDAGAGQADMDVVGLEVGARTEIARGPETRPSPRRTIFPRPAKRSGALDRGARSWASWAATESLRRRAPEVDAAREAERRPAGGVRELHVGDVHHALRIALGGEREDDVADGVLGDGVLVDVADCGVHA